MHKFIFTVVLSILFCVTGCSAKAGASETSELENCKMADSKFRFKQVSMCDSQTGWALTTGNELLFTREGVEKFALVKAAEETNAQTDNFASIFCPDEKTVYLVYFSPDNSRLVIEYTQNGGISWQKTLLDYNSFGDACDAGSAYINIAEDGTGYLLYCSTPGAGLMTKILLNTVDGGETFSVAADLSSEIAGYPKGISFAGDKGYIAVSYHGSDEYLFVTEDGGTTWKSRKIQTEDETAGYIDGYQPVFLKKDSELGMIVLKTVEEDTSWKVFRTEDGGSSWKPAARLTCPSLSGYAYAADDYFLFWDEDGQLYEGIW